VPLSIGREPVRQAEGKCIRRQPQRRRQRAQCEVRLAQVELLIDRGSGRAGATAKMTMNAAAAGAMNVTPKAIANVRR
jgi:hypothetical protein